MENAARYWGIRTKTVDGGVLVAVGELEFRMIEGQPEDHSGLTAMATSTYGTADYGPYKAFNKSNAEGEFWASYHPNIYNEIIALDFVTPRGPPAEFLLTSRLGDYNQTPSTFELVYSHDAANWHVCVTVRDQHWSAGDITRTYKVPSGGLTEARYWLINTQQVQIVEGATNLWSIGELQFRGVEGVAESHAELPHFSPSWHQAPDETFHPRKAFDGNAATLHAGVATGHTEKWLGVDFGTPRSVREIMAQCRSDGYREQMTGGFDLEASNDKDVWQVRRSFRNLNWNAGLVQHLKVNPTGQFGVSLRRIGSYSGACLRVRRSSDGQQQDFGFAGNVVDMASISAFVGSGTGTVPVWYNQQGGWANLDQTNGTGYEPIIVDAGVPVTNGAGKPAIRISGGRFFNGKGRFMGDTPTPKTIVATAQLNGSGYRTLMNQRSSNGSGNGFGYSPGGNLCLMRNGVSDVQWGANPGNNPHVVSWQLGGAWYWCPGRPRLNGVEQPGNYTQGTGGYFEDFSVGRPWSGALDLFDGYVSEIQVWNDTNVPDIASIESTAAYYAGVAGYTEAPPDEGGGSGAIITRRRPLWING